MHLFEYGLDKDEAGFSRNFSYQRDAFINGSTVFYIRVRFVFSLATSRADSVLTESVLGDHAPGTLPPVSTYND